MAKSETVTLELRCRYSGVQVIRNDLVAGLPGLLISQFRIPEEGRGAETTALRFDFVDDWYSIIAFLDRENRPTGFYTISVQTPLRELEGVWVGDELLLAIEVFPNGRYLIRGEEEFLSAVEEGWMRVYCAAKARDTLHTLISMISDGRLPQEVMDAVWT